jgi:methionyl-tRNA synthetase
MVGGAWPYANGPLHIGHLTALLPGDAIARYWRMRGADVCYISGSDCHGTPITARAFREGVAPVELTAHYHSRFTKTLERYGFSFDRFGSTSNPEHIAFASDFHRSLASSEYVEDRDAPQAFCPRCAVPLVGRMTVGTCSRCGSTSRGDQCSSCGALQDPATMRRAVCARCGSPVSVGTSRQRFLLLGKLAPRLREFLDSRAWPSNAVAPTREYLQNPGDLAMSRSIEWGIPMPGLEDKTIYMWCEDMLGYLSQSLALDPAGFDELWRSPESYHYLVFGIDNLLFHSVVFPAMLMPGGWHLPDQLVCSEFLTLGGRRIATSDNWALWADDIAAVCSPDLLRWYLLAHGTLGGTADFTVGGFLDAVDSGLPGMVNRLHLEDRIIPDTYLEETFTQVGDAIAEGRPDRALRLIEDFIFQNPTAHALANLAVLLRPFCPETADRLGAQLGVGNEKWEPVGVPSGEANGPIFDMPDARALHVLEARATSKEPGPVVPFNANTLLPSGSRR